VLAGLSGYFVYNTNSVFNVESVPIETHTHLNKRNIIHRNDHPSNIQIPVGARTDHANGSRCEQPYSAPTHPTKPTYARTIVSIAPTHSSGSHSQVPPFSISLPSAYSFGISCLQLSHIIMSIQSVSHISKCPFIRCLTHIWVHIIKCLASPSASHIQVPHISECMVSKCLTYPSVWFPSVSPIQVLGIQVSECTAYLSVSHIQASHIIMLIQYLTYPSACSFSVSCPLNASHILAYHIIILIHSMSHVPHVPMHSVSHFPSVSHIHVPIQCLMSPSISRSSISCLFIRCLIYPSAYSFSVSCPRVSHISECMVSKCLT